MAEQLLDGTGNNYRAKVNSSHQLLVEAVTAPVRHHMAHNHGKGFVSEIQQTPSGANKAFAYIKNNDEDDLNLWCLRLAAAGLETVELWSVTGTAAGTTATPVNLFVGDPTAADATHLVGNDITGLTKSKLLRRLVVEANKATAEHEIKSAVIVKKNYAIALYAVTGSILVNAGLTFDFHSALS